MPEEGAAGAPVGTTMQNWMAGTIVGTMAIIVLSIFIPGWIVFTDINSDLQVSASIYYWMVCGAKNTTCGAHGVGQPDAYVYIEKTNATPDTTLLLVSVDMIICIMCAVIVLGDMAGMQPKTTWWNNLKLGALIFIIFVLNLVIIGLFGHSSITLSEEPTLVVNVPYSLFILSLAVLLALLEFCFLIYIHRVSTIPYRRVPTNSIEEDQDQPSTSQPSINRPC